MTNYKAYPNYREIDSKLLNEIPIHWFFKRFRFIVRDGYDGLKIGPFGSQIKLDDLRNEGYKIYGQENVINRDFVAGSRFIDEEKFQELGVYEIQEGDLLITMMGTSGKCEIVPRDLQTGIMDSHLIRLRVNHEINSRFVRYLIDESLYIKGQIDLWGKGSIMNGLNSSIIKSLNFPYPELNEQINIVHFLDNKTAQIDRLIQKKKALLEKLNEKRMAFITQAVTKGLNSDAPMKLSGVDWLGDVPAHWDVRKLKFCINVEGGGTPNTSVKEYWDGDIPWVSPKDMKTEHIFKTQDYITELGLHESATNLIKTEAVLLVVRSGILKHSIPVAINAVPVTINQDMKALIVNRDFLLNEYLMALIYGLQKSLLPTWSKPGCTVESIEFEYMINTLIPLPPIEEQSAIVFKINEEKKKIDAMLHATTQTIERLTEYRTALITATVTGKIDVRGIDIPSQEAV